MLMLILWVSCVPKNNEKQQENPPFALKTFLDNFISENPNIGNNEITLKDGEGVLCSEIQKNIGDTLAFFSQLPFEFEMAMEYPQSPFDFETESYPNAGKYVIKFGFGEYTSNCTISDNYKVTFQVFAVVGKEIVSPLVKGGLYHINGKFKDFANCHGSFVLPSGKCFDGSPRISLLDNKLHFNIGTLILEDITISKIDK